MHVNTRHMFFCLHREPYSCLLRSSMLTHSTLMITWMTSTSRSLYHQIHSLRLRQISTEILETLGYHSVSVSCVLQTTMIQTVLHTAFPGMMPWGTTHVILTLAPRSVWEGGPEWTVLLVSAGLHEEVACILIVCLSQCGLVRAPYSLCGTMITLQVLLLIYHECAQSLFST